MPFPTLARTRLQDMNSSAIHVALSHSLLNEALVRWRCVARGDLQRSSLPDLFAAMARDEVRDFPALRPHQRHPWHAFLAQLAAIALHRAGQSRPGPVPPTGVPRCSR